VFGFEYYFYLHLVSWTFFQIHVTIKNEWFKHFEWLQLDNGPASDCSTSKSCESDKKLFVTKHNSKIINKKNMHLIVKYLFTLHFKSFLSDSHDFEVEQSLAGPLSNWSHSKWKTFQFQIQNCVSDSDFLFTFNVYHMDDKDKSDLVMVSNESETDSYPRKRQVTLLSFLTNPIVKKSKADTKLKKNLWQKWHSQN
jgi:hypothetical protein